MPLILAHMRTRPGAVIALVTLAMISGQTSASAQFPQCRITSLSRPGLRSGESVEVTFRGSDLEGAHQLWFDDPGLKATHVKDATFRVTCAPDVPLGQHDVRLVGTFGVSNPRTFVVGDRPEQIEIEPNNTPEKATPIVAGSVSWGEISAAAEVDCFAFDGKKGQRVILDLQAERIDSRLDATLRLLSPSGTELAESRDVFGADPFLDVTLPADGRYVIKLHDAIYAGSPDHVYRLLVHDGPHLDAILPLACSPGSKGTFTVMGRGLGEDAVADSSQKVEGRPLERFATIFTTPRFEDLGPSRMRTFTPSAAATVGEAFDYRFTRLSSSGAASLSSNLLRLAATPEPVLLEKEPNNEEGSAQTVVPPCDISGTFGGPGDLDFYRFQGRKGEVWRIEVIAERQGSPADPVLLIQKVGAKGQPSQDLASGDDLPDAGAGARFNTQSVDADVRFQVPEDGLYQVQLSDLYASQRGDPRLFYRLSMRSEHPDFRLVLVPNNAAETDAVTVRAGGRTSAYVIAIRLDGFSGPIRVEAQSLPRAVRFSPVVIGPGQILAPVVFEADRDAKDGVGSVTLLGRGRFGDRKDELSYVSGASSLGRDVAHIATAGGMTWPPNASVKSVAPARFFHGFVVAVRGDPAPLGVTARPEKLTVAQGRQINLQVDATRSAGFVEAVAVTGTDLPPGVPASSVTIPKEAKTATLPVFVPRNAPPGTYSFVLRGSGPFLFHKDPKAKDKPKTTLTEPSNPIMLTVRPAPLSLSIDNKGGNLKQGQRLEIEASISRQNGFAGPATLTLNAPANLRLAADPVTLTRDQSKAKLVLKAAKDSPPGASANVTIRATATVRDESIEVDEPLALTVNK